MNYPNDPTADIYALFDKAKLTAGHLLTAKQPMAKTINELRTTLAKDLAAYIKAREAERNNQNGTTGQ